MSAILRKPSIAVASWACLVIAVFAWRGDLGLGASGPGSEEFAHIDTPDGPVVVRRDTDTRLPRAERRGLVFDSMGFLLVGAEVVPAEGRTQRTDADGSFAIELVKQHTSDLLVRADGRRPAWVRTSAVAPDPLIVRLEPAAPWDGALQPLTPAPMLRGEGEVVGPDGEPLKNAFVNVLGTEVWGRTDDIGRVELPLPARGVTFVVHAPAIEDGQGGLAVCSAPFVSPRARGIVPLPRLVAEPAGSIRGVVRDARGQAVAGLPVEVRGAGSVRRIETGAGGVFVLGGLLPEEYVVEPFAYRGEVGVATPVRVDRAVVPCDVQLQPVEESRLRVVDERGEAAAGVWVAANLGGVRRGVAQADVGGRVSLPVAASTEFEVRSAAGYA
ncbi:MAG: carboxypeptidase regulatory-like domain-containing protein, partial [Planctomycetes bacterium]|nr:carboxypeptidase regulatory-like domain-containing protein [Planctomycetota bacterium]